MRCRAEVREQLNSIAISIAIIVNIDVMLAKRKMSVTEQAEKVGITMVTCPILCTSEIVNVAQLRSAIDALDRRLGLYRLLPGGDHENAIRHYRDVMTVDPHSQVPYWGLGKTLLL